MGFTESVFIFVLFPVSIAGTFLFRFLEEKFTAIKRLRLKDIFLCLFSLFFYSFFSLYQLCCILVLIALTIVGGRLIHRSKARRKLIAALTVTVFVLILFVFKYFVYDANLILSAVGASYRFERLIAPVGVSFVVFSAISYLVDVYRGDAAPGSVIDAALYLSFFPKVISGPIVKWKEFSPQIAEAKPDSGLFVTGMNRLCIGFAKKVILADTFGSYVTEVQENMAIGVDTASAWIMLVLFFFEIYLDFSGYSDIAIGIANMLGYRFDNNFNFPYLSTSITDFWRRWHISLGSWFRDYLYIPLGGNRRSKARTLLNLMIVFIVTGVWHGAGLLYLMWGVWHGIFVVIERLIRDTKVYRLIPAVIKWAFTIAVVMIGWSAFCFDSAGELLKFFGLLIGQGVPDKPGVTALYFCNIKAIATTAIALIGSTVFGIKGLRKLPEKLSRRPVTFILTETVVLAIFVLALIFMMNSTYSPFLYFRY